MTAFFWVILTATATGFVLRWHHVTTRLTRDLAAISEQVDQDRNTGRWTT